jgi:hypothetical protein
MSKQPLVPLEVKIKIGEREYVQKPFGLDRTALLFSLMSVILRKTTEYPEFYGQFNKMVENAKSGEADETGSLEQVASLLSAIFAILPDTMMNLIFLCLDIHNSKDDQEYVKVHGEPSQMLEIVGTMADQNDLKKVWQDFLALRSKLTAIFAKS